MDTIINNTKLPLPKIEYSVSVSLSHSLSSLNLWYTRINQLCIAINVLNSPIHHHPHHSTPYPFQFRYTYTAMRISIPRPSIFLRLLSTPHNKPVPSCHIYPLNLTYFHLFPFRPGYVVHSSVPLPLGKWDNRVTSSYSYFAAVASCRRRTG